jgi:hypothetical protein
MKWGRSSLHFVKNHPANFWKGGALLPVFIGRRRSARGTAPKADYLAAPAFRGPVLLSAFSRFAEAQREELCVRPCQRQTGRGRSVPASMVRTLMIAAASAAILSLSPTAFAQGQFGTADEAKAMLTKAVTAVKADRDVAHTRPCVLARKAHGRKSDRPAIQIQQGVAV